MENDATTLDGVVTELQELRRAVEEIQLGTKPRALSVVAAAGRLGIGEALLRKMMRMGIVRGVRIGRRIVVPLSEVERLLELALDHPGVDVFGLFGEDEDSEKYTQRR